MLSEKIRELRKSHRISQVALCYKAKRFKLGK